MTAHQVHTLSSTEPTQIVGTSYPNSPSEVTIQNLSATATVYLGGTNLTSSNYGIRLSPGMGYSTDLGPSDCLFALSSSNGSTISSISVAGKRR